jgi:hypothetical protein
LNNRLREECLNRSLWNTLFDARVVIGDFKAERTHRYRRLGPGLGVELHAYPHWAPTTCPPRPVRDHAPLGTCQQGIDNGDGRYQSLPMV